jgi:hypothetical protein
LKFDCSVLRESKRFTVAAGCKPLTLKVSRNGMLIAIYQGASDVPAAGKKSGQPAKKSRRSARAAANEAADRPRKPAKGAVDITTGHNLLGGQ